eukprot:9090128-Alexandrium_andersonii.AAC.1
MPFAGWRLCLALHRMTAELPLRALLVPVHCGGGARRGAGGSAASPRAGRDPSRGPASRASSS